MIKHYLILVLIFTLLACGSADKVLLNSNSVVLAFGDSLTQGVGAQPNQSYPVVLQQILGVSVVNSGISGQTSEQGLKRLEQELIKHQPDLVILCYGGNDILRRKSRIELKNNLALMIQIAKDYGVEVLLVAVPEPGLILSPLPLYKELRDEYDVFAELEVLSDLLSTAGKKSDSVHLNADGYRDFASILSNHIAIE